MARMSGSRIWKLRRSLLWSTITASGQDKSPRHAGFASAKLQGLEKALGEGEIKITISHFRG